MLIGSFAIGSYYYGKFTLTEINFIKVNHTKRSTTLLKNGLCCSAVTLFGSILFLGYRFALAFIYSLF